MKIKEALEEILMGNAVAVRRTAWRSTHFLTLAKEKGKLVAYICCCHNIKGREHEVLEKAKWKPGIGDLNKTDYEIVKQEK